MLPTTSLVFSRKLIEGLISLLILFHFPSKYFLFNCDNLGLRCQPLDENGNREALCVNMDPRNHKIWSNFKGLLFDNVPCPEGRSLANEMKLGKLSQ